MTTALSVNLNKIALIRNSRPGNWPDILFFATLALKAGAQGVTIHPRPDERHARIADIQGLKTVVQEFHNAELNVEGYPDERFMRALLACPPNQATLVPDTREQQTSDHGWDPLSKFDFLKDKVSRLQKAGIRVSLFLDPEIELVSAAADTGAQRIELYTGPYAHDYARKGKSCLHNYKATADKARALGLGVNAGHDLNQENLVSLMQAIEPDEVSIGHALTVEALFEGFEPTIRAYLDLLNNPA